MLGQLEIVTLNAGATLEAQLETMVCGVGGWARFCLGFTVYGFETQPAGLTRTLSRAHSDLATKKLSQLETVTQNVGSTLEAQLGTMVCGVGSQNKPLRVLLSETFPYTSTVCTIRAYALNSQPSILNCSAVFTLNAWASDSLTPCMCVCAGPGGADQLSGEPGSNHAANQGQSAYGGDYEGGDEADL